VRWPDFLVTVYGRIEVTAEVFNELANEAGGASTSHRLFLDDGRVLRGKAE
jgi:hypothetical protein